MYIHKIKYIPKKHISFMQNTRKKEDFVTNNRKIKNKFINKRYLKMFAKSFFKFF